MTRKKENKEEDWFLRKAIRGERAGLEYLVDKYKDMAFTIALKIVSIKEDAEEVVQDAFIKAFASLGKFRRTAKFSTWLYRIVYNTAISRVRAKTFELRDLRTSKESDESEERNSMKQAEQRFFLDKAFEKLSSKDRLVLILHYLGEKSIEEVCEILDMKRSAVKMRLLRARKELKTQLELLLGDELKDLL